MLGRWESFKKSVGEWWMSPAREKQAQMLQVPPRRIDYNDVVAAGRNLGQYFALPGVLRVTFDGMSLAEREEMKSHPWHSLTRLEGNKTLVSDIDPRTQLVTRSVISDKPLEQVTSQDVRTLLGRP